MISISHAFKSTLESALKTSKDVRCGAFILRLRRYIAGVGTRVWERI
jgi:hypothetical protein